MPVMLSLYPSKGGGLGFGNPDINIFDDLLRQVPSVINNIRSYQRFNS
jgi:hypothetical protein